MPQNDRPRTFTKNYPGRIKRRGTEPPEHIWIPAIGLVPHARIACFVAFGGSYSWMYLKDEENPRLISEPLGYFQKQLPDFKRAERSILVNPNRKPF